MTNPENSRREELSRILPKKVIIAITPAWEKYNQAIDDCLSTLENKVILRSELLSVEKIENLIWDSLGTDEESERNYQLNTLFGDKIKPLAQQIHDRQEGR